MEENKVLTNALRSHRNELNGMYQKFIDPILLPLKSVISKDDNKILKTLELVHNYFGADRNIDSIIRDYRVDGHSLILNKNSEWSPLNKLNTNWSAASILVSELINTYYSDRIDDIVNDLKYKKFGYLEKTLENDILSIPGIREKILSHILNDQEKFVKHIRRPSSQGSEGEDRVEMFVKKEYGYNTIYKGGDGDFIDMKLGIDLIMEKNGDYIFTQVKSVNSIEIIVRNNTYYYEIDGNVSLPIWRLRYVNCVGYYDQNNKEVIFSENNKYYTKIGNKWVLKSGLPIPNGIIYVEKK